MIIGNNQLESFNEINLEKFISITIPFLKNNFQEFIKDKPESELISIISLIVKWAAQYKVHAGINIQKLLHHKIVYGWGNLLPEKLEKYLVDPELHENFRTENFCAELVSERYKLIEINSDSDLRKLAEIK